MTTNQAPILSGDLDELDAVGQAALVRSGAEATLLSLASAPEAACPWWSKRPPRPA